MRPFGGTLPWSCNASPGAPRLRCSCGNAGLQEMGGEAMAQDVHAHALVDSGRGARRTAGGVQDGPPLAALAAFDRMIIRPLSMPSAFRSTPPTPREPAS